MVIAALISFALLLIAWILAPNREALKVALDESTVDLVPATA